MEVAVGVMVLSEGVERDVAVVADEAVVAATVCPGGFWGEMDLTTMAVTIATVVVPFLLE